MEKVDYLSEEELINIGRQIGEVFVAECDGIAADVPKEDAIKAFEIMTEYYYKSGVLFTTSDRHEGFLAYWHKNTKINVKGAVHMVFRLLKEVSLRSVVKVAEVGGELYAKLYKKVMIERCAFHISMVKVFGYRTKEIRKLYLDGNLYVIAAGAVIYVAVLLIYSVINELLTAKLKKVNLAEVLKNRE